MEKLPKVTWVIGGLQPSSVPWNGPPGRTGFVYNVRTIEEPNILCDKINEYFSKGLFANVETCFFECETLEETIDEILIAYYSKTTKDQYVNVWFLPRWHTGSRDGYPWMRLFPKGRMTRHESWIVDANFSRPDAVDD